MSFESDDSAPRINEGYEPDLAPATQTNGYITDQDTNVTNGHDITESNGHVIQNAVTEQVRSVASPSDAHTTGSDHQTAPPTDHTQVTIVTQTSTEPLCETAGKNEAKAACVLGFLVFLLCGGLFGLVGMLVAYLADKDYKNRRFKKARNKRNLSVTCSVTGVAVFLVTIVILIIIYTKRGNYVTLGHY